MTESDPSSIKTVPSLKSLEEINENTSKKSLEDTQKLDKDADPTRNIDYSAVQIEEPVSYTWKDIKVVTVNSTCQKLKQAIRKKPIQRKTLIFNAYGEAKPGELLAIMGSSGAGKTTLLNCLTFRTDRNLEISGSRLINGRLITSTSLASISGYVHQQDLFIGTLTVKESLIFHSMLRMHSSIPFRKRIDRIEEVMAEFNLKKCENTLVGIPGKIKGISGGETKRLAFAAEVLTDPMLLFCDEPTSGLDSFMAQYVVTVMRDMARKGKTVISTIHQPSSDVYALFDKILFMAEGKLAFLGTPDEANRFFRSLGSICPINHNPADFYIHLLAIAPGKEEECRKAIKRICESYDQSKMGKEVMSNASDIKEVTKQRSKQNEKSKYKAGCCEQFRAVFWRSWISVTKDPSILKTKFIETIIVAVLVGLIYWNQEMDQDGVMNINGAIFITLSQVTFQNLFAVIHVFCNEMPIFMREHDNGMYRTDVYFISKNLAEFPVSILLPTMFTLIIYYMVRMNPLVERYIGAVVVMVLIGSVATSFGYVMSCMCSNVGMALSVAPSIVIPILLFGGFFLNTRSIPGYLSWLQHISWFKFGNEALLINQWKGVNEIDCKGLNATCPRNGMIILDSYNFSETNYFFDLVILFVIQSVFRIWAFIALFVRAKYKLI